MLTMKDKTNIYAKVVIVTANEDVEKVISTATAEKQRNAPPTLVVASHVVTKEKRLKLSQVFDIVLVGKPEEDLAIGDDKKDSGVGGQLFMVIDVEEMGRWRAVEIVPHLERFRELMRENLDFKCGDGRSVKIYFDKKWKNDIKYSNGSNSVSVVHTKALIVNPCNSDHARIGDKRLSTRDQNEEDWVAIVGMACRFPEANSAEEYWDVFLSEKTTCGVPPPHRRRLIDIDPEMKANFLKCPIDKFDAGFFGVSPAEAAFTNPQGRLLMEVTWEAFEHAGINPVELKGSKTGVFHGSWQQDYRDALNTCTASNTDFFRKYLGNGVGSVSAKPSYYFGFTGLNVSTDAACSSSMVAVDMAVKSLQRKECPLAVVTGSNLLQGHTNENISGGWVIKIV